MAGKSKNIKTIICILICLSLVVTAIGIGVPIYALSNTEKSYEQLSKQKVAFSNSGEYNISFKEGDMLKVEEDGNLKETREDLPVDFGSITKEDVVVSYDYVDYTGEKTNNTDGIPGVGIIHKSAEITEFQNDGKQIAVSFSDDKDFPNNGNDAYAIYMEKAQRVVLVEPQVPDNTLSSNTKEVSSESNQNTIVVTSKEGNFSPTIKPEDISLGYSFKDMTVDSVVADGKRLMINLSGSPVIIPEMSSVYTDGEIKIAPSGFEKATKPEEITFEIAVPLVAIDTSAITGSNGTYTVPINVSGVDVSKLNEDTIDFGDNTKVKSVTKKNGQVIAEVEAENMDDLGGHIQIGDNHYLSGYSHASVGVFPLAYNKEGDNFVIDIFVSAINGKIKKNLDKSQINLHDDFEGGSIVSINEQEEQDITLRIEVPSNGVSVEDMNLMGTLEFAEGALVEDWGDNAPAYFVTATYNKDLFEVINSTGMNDVTGLSNSSVLASLFGNVVYAAQPDANNNAAANNNNNGNNNAANNNNANNNNANNNAAANNNNANNNAAANNNNNANNNAAANNNADAVKKQRTSDNRWSTADMAVNYTVDKLQNVNATAAAVSKGCKIAYDFGKAIISGNPAAAMTGLLDIFDAIGLFRGGEDPNNPSNKTMDDKINDINVLLQAMDKKLDTVIKNQYKAMTQGYENALDALSTDCVRADAIARAASNVYVSRGGVIPTKNASEKQLKDYNAALVKIINEEEKNNNANFRGYTQLIQRIENNYILVTTETAKEWDKNPIFYNDKCWSEYFNYESQGYFMRVAYRSNVEYQISRAFKVLSFYYEMAAYPDIHKDLAQRQTRALDMIEEHPGNPEPMGIKADTSGPNNPGVAFNVELNAPVYSSTLNKSVVGWYIPTNGVCEKFLTTDWHNNIKEEFNVYTGGKEVCDKYISKLHGNSVKDDLLLAFPELGPVFEKKYTVINGSTEDLTQHIYEVKNMDKTIDGIGFGGKWAESKCRLRFTKRHAFTFHDWLWWENMVGLDGKYGSYNTYDTGGPVDDRKVALRFWFK